MTEHEENGTTERLSAHERLATGGARALDAHVRQQPVAGRRHLDRDHRGPDRPRRHDRRLAARRVRDSRVGHAEGDRPDRGGVRLRAGRRAQHRVRGAGGRAARHAGAQGGDREGDRAPEDVGVQARQGDGKAGLTSVGDPFSKDTFSKDGRIAYAEAQFDQTIEDTDRPQVVAVEDAVRETVEPAGVTVEYNGEAEFPPLEQGISEALGLLAAIIVLLFVFRTFVAMLIPIALAIVGADDGLPAALHPRRADRHQHGHADPRLDDRARGRDRLLAVHRHALQTATPRRPRAAGRGGRGRRVGRPRGAVRRPHGRDLGRGPGVHRARLRDEARDRQRARRADDGADRELAAARRARAARPQDRPAQGAVHEAVRRLGGGTREDARRPLGPLRDRATRRSSSRRAPDRPGSSSRARRRSCASAPPTRARSPRRRRAAAPTTCSPRASEPASTGRSRSSST